MKPGTKVKFWDIKYARGSDKIISRKRRVITFLRRSGGYHYFQVGKNKKNVVELYENEFEVVK